MLVALAVVEIRVGAIHPVQGLGRGGGPGEWPPAGRPLQPLQVTARGGRLSFHGARRQLVDEQIAGLEFEAAMCSWGSLTIEIGLGLPPRTGCIEPDVVKVATGRRLTGHPPGAVAASASRFCNPMSETPRPGRRRVGGRSAGL